jgi:hypothetical protein
MNERIKELAEQAGFNPYNYQGSNSALFEKFAELIITECIYNAFCNGDDIEYVKKHFGVK